MAKQKSKGAGRSSTKRTPTKPTPEQPPAGYPPPDVERVMADHESSGLRPELLIAQQRLNEILFDAKNWEMAHAGKRPGMVGPTNFLGSYIGTKRIGGRSTGKWALVVMVRRKVRDERRVPAGAMIPKRIVVEYAGKSYIVPVDVVEVGQTGTRDNWNDDVDLLEGFNVFENPALCGTTISPTTGPALSGTFGAVVTNANNDRFILSNNHVLAGVRGTFGGTKTGLPDGTPIGHPGQRDLTDDHPNQLTVGTLTKVVPLILLSPGSGPSPGVINTVDAAIAKTDMNGLDYEFHGVGGEEEILGQPGVPTNNMLVKKAGRTTGFTEGRVTGIHAQHGPIGYNAVNPNTGQLISAEAFFSDVFVIEGTDPGRPFSWFGDSGSVIRAQDDGRGVGLLFAGSSSGPFGASSVTFAIPIKTVFAAFGLTQFVNFLTPT